jgi:H+/Na+-translocating ferredoxin:NAD+ oxidoreductase subunit B
VKRYRHRLILNDTSRKEQAVTDRIYLDLRERLDRDPLGFPATESGLELAILRRLFTEEEAGTYLHLNIEPVQPPVLARRIGGDAARVIRVLETLVVKGLVFRVRKGSSLHYAALPFFMGSFEYQLRNKDRQLAELLDRFFPEAFGDQGISIGRPIRIVPVSKAVDVSFPEEPHEDVKAIVIRQHTIAVSKCICRVRQRLLDEGCNRPLEACLQFGKRARDEVNKGTGRFVTTEEALEIVDKCGEAGLVSQPFTVPGSGALCNCCGDCCLILRTIKLDPKPAQRVWTDYSAKVNPEACSACGTCMERCQIEAVRIGAADVAEVDPDRCIGCGLCVMTCPSGALSLRKKPESDRRAPAAAKNSLMQLVSHEVRYFIGKVEAAGG